MLLLLLLLLQVWYPNNGRPVWICCGAVLLRPVSEAMRSVILCYRTAVVLVSLVPVFLLPICCDDPCGVALLPRPQQVVKRGRQRYFQPISTTNHHRTLLILPWIILFIVKTRTGVKKCPLPWKCRHHHRRIVVKTAVPVIQREAPTSRPWRCPNPVLLPRPTWEIPRWPRSRKNVPWVNIIPASNSWKRVVARPTAAAVNSMMLPMPVRRQHCKLIW